LYIIIHAIDIDKELGLLNERGILPNNAENDVQLKHFTRLLLKCPSNSNVNYNLQSMIGFIYFSLLIIFLSYEKIRFKIKYFFPLSSEQKTLIV
jgi:hypothetical protein